MEIYKRDMDKSVASHHHGHFLAFSFYIHKQFNERYFFLPFWLEMCLSGQITQEKQQVGLPSSISIQKPGPQLSVHTD